MKENLVPALNMVLDFEGRSKVTDDPDDRGGLTKWGISQNAHPDVDVINLTREQAIAIYKREYWDVIGGDELPYPVDVICFDMAVNHGQARAVRFLQSSLNGVTVALDPLLPKLKVDGNCGQLTRGRARWFVSANILSTSLLARDLLLRRSRFYALLVKSESQRKYIYGWMRQRVVVLGIKVGVFSNEDAI